jgi:hypothetical protein
MTSATRRSILRSDALFLGIAGAGGFVSDVLGVFYARGPVGTIVAAAPHAGIGFIEAHGLAFIVACLLWRAAPARSWHVTAAMVHLLLGTANLACWQIFVAADMLAVGYITTALHGLFVALQLAAAVPNARVSSSDEPERITRRAES